LVEAKRADCHYTPASLQGATNEMARQEGEKLVQYLKEAGFSPIRLEVKK
jgi:hypothetical protein